MVLHVVEAAGDVTLFTWQMLGGLFHRRRANLLPTMYRIGVQSTPVVMVTGAFVGMVLAVQSYGQFAAMNMENRLGAVINLSLLNELGPVLAAVMLAGRVGSAMAAELGTMRVTEQIDALRALGANPVHHLVVPRFLACFLMIPLLTAIADAIGCLAGGAYCTTVLGIDSYEYWYYGSRFASWFDVFTGMVKSTFFGAAIALSACHRGFHCGAGAQGVGRAATEAFVLSFVAILVLDFFLGVFLQDVYVFLFGTGAAALF